MISRSERHQTKSQWWAKTSAITLVTLGVGFIGYGGYNVYHASTGTQHVMKQSKSVKEVYGQGARGKEEHQNRATFDKIYYKYVKQDGSTLVHTDQAIDMSDVTKLDKLADKTGAYYKDNYSDKAKIFKTLASVQNDYIGLWAYGHVGSEFAKNVRPSTIYLFNSNHYNDLQTLLALNADSQYPIWMTSEMQKMGNDAINVENFVQRFATYFDFPSAKTPWKVEHSYTSTTQDKLLAAYHDLGYKWRILSFMPDLLDASAGAATKNENMQSKVDAANALIASIKASSIASSQAKADSESRARSAKESSEAAVKASEAASKSSSEEAVRSSSEAAASSAAESSRLEAERRSSSSEASASVVSTPDMPNFVGKNVINAVNWAQANNVQVVVQAVTTGSHQDNEVLSQSRSGNVYTLTYFRALPQDNQSHNTRSSNVSTSNSVNQ